MGGIHQPVRHSRRFDRFMVCRLIRIARVRRTASPAYLQMRNRLYLYENQVKHKSYVTFVLLEGARLSTAG